MKRTRITKSLFWRPLSIRAKHHKMYGPSARYGSLYSVNPTGMSNQARILMSLIQGQEGRAWALGKKGWDESFELNMSVCKWDYIQCDSYQTTVIGIEMIEADFVGTLPSELGDLVTLETINLRRNLIVGTIPSEIANLHHLKEVYLSENRLTGTIPNFASYKLEKLDLQYNLLSGSLNPDFGYSNPKLLELDVASNKIKGHLPTLLPNPIRSKIMTLSLSRNEFSGTIHSFYGSIPSLTYLYLDGNNLMGTIPSFDGSGSVSGQSILGDGHSGMQELWLQQNLLTGTIPPAIGEIQDLYNFYVDENKLTGVVPTSLCRSDINEDFFENIDIDPKRRNYCDSIACPAGKVSFEGVYPCEECKDMFFNPYLGRVDECIDLKEADIIQTFYDATSGEKWVNMEKDEVWDIDGSFVCDLEGITCGNHGNIISINLKGRGLRGTIPEEIGYLRFLEVLDLSNNHISGFLPPDLRWAPLRSLDVSGNRIKGIIPHTLCRKEGINGNGKDGEFDCDFVQCSPGTFNHKGRATNKAPCKPCHSTEYTPFIGSLQCSTLFQRPVVVYLEEATAVIILFFMCFFCVAGFYLGCLTYVVKKQIAWGEQEEGQKLNSSDDVVKEEEEHVRNSSVHEKIENKEHRHVALSTEENDDSFQSDTSNEADLMLMTKEGKNNEFEKNNLITLDLYEDSNGKEKNDSYEDTKGNHYTLDFQDDAKGESDTDEKVTKIITERNRSSNDLKEII